MGARLFDALFSDPDVYGLYEQTRAKAGPERLRIRLVVDPDEPVMGALHSLLLELIEQHSIGERLACEGRVSIVRSLVVRRPTAAFEPRRRLRVLVVLSGAEDLDLDGEREIFEGLSERFHRFEAECTVASDLEALELHLREAVDAHRPFQVLHFGGHGTIAAGPKGGVLEWEPRGRPTQTVSGRDLSALVQRFPALQLVVLNACSTADLPGDGRDPFAGVAAALLRGGLPVVVATQGRIADDAAVLFTRTFYGHLAAGNSPEEAMVEARWALWKADLEAIEWVKPVLFQGAFERPRRLPRWLKRGAGGLGVLLALLAGLSGWQWQALCERTVAQRLEAATTLLLDHRPAEAARTLDGALGQPFCPHPAPPTLAAVHAAAAAAREDMGDLRGAVDHARQAARLLPDLAVHQYNLGALLARFGRPQDAVAPLCRAIELDPDASVARNELGCVYLELGRPDDARSVLEAALKVTSESPLVHKNLALALLALDRPSDAIPHLEQAVELTPRSDWPELAEAAFHLARARLAVGNLPGACRALQLVQSSDPDAATEFANAGAELLAAQCLSGRPSREEADAPDAP